MNKSDLVAQIAQNAGVSKAAAAKAFNSMIEGISESLSKGDSVRFPGFGTFSVANRPARTGVSLTILLQFTDLSLLIGLAYGVLIKEVKLAVNKQ